MRTRINDVLGPLIDESVNSASPRDGFAAELLAALKEMPVIPVTGDAKESGALLRWVVPGAVVGTIGASAALWYGLNRRSRRNS
jgi:hypothetical protein